MFPSLSIGNTSLAAQFDSIFGQGERNMEIRKLDPSNPADAARLEELAADNGLYHGDENGEDFDDDDGSEIEDDYPYVDDDGYPYVDDDYDSDDDMDDPEHRLDYILKINEQ